MENIEFNESVKAYKLLAQERTILANERNTLAYLRTGFSAFVLGLGFLKFFPKDTLMLYSGYGSITLGVIFLLSG